MGRKYEWVREKRTKRAERVCWEKGESDMMEGKEPGGDKVFSEDIFDFTL